jgi:hypothetical protein
MGAVGHESLFRIFGIFRIVASEYHLFGAVSDFGITSYLAISQRIVIVKGIAAYDPVFLFVKGVFAKEELVGYGLVPPIFAVEVVLVAVYMCGSMKEGHFRLGVVFERVGVDRVVGIHYLDAVLEMGNVAVGIIMTFQAGNGFVLVDDFAPVKIIGIVAFGVKVE